MIGQHADSTPVRRRPRLRPARRRQDGDPLDRAAARAATTSRSPTPRASPGSARRSPRDPTLARRLHLGVQHGRRGHRRHRGARASATSARRAAMPVMEGKAVLFKQFGGVDAVPICLDTTDVDEIIETVVRLAPELRRHQPRGHLARRAASRSSDRLKELLDIPVFHDDQHGTAVVVLAALRNALRLTGRGLRRPAGRHLRRRRRRRRGHHDPARGRHRRPRRRRPQGRAARRRATTSPPVKRALAAITADRLGRTGTLADVLAGADVFIGVSGGTVPEEVVAAMARRRDHLRPGQPEPRGAPRRRRTGTRAVVATGRSRLPQPDQQRARLPRASSGAPSTCGATAITEGMKLAAADGARRWSWRRPDRGR